MQKTESVNLRSSDNYTNHSSDMIAFPFRGDIMSESILTQNSSSVNSKINGAPKKRVAVTGAISNDLPAKSSALNILSRAATKSVDAKPSIAADSEPEASSQIESTQVYKFQPLSLEDLLNMPPKEWLFENFIGKGDLAMIYGEPGCGKTFVVIDMIFAGCLGKRFAMRFEPSKQMNIAYCAGEGNGGLPARFNAASAHYGVKKLPNFTFFPIVPQLYDGDSNGSLDGIKTFIAEWKVRQDAGITQPLDILIIDTMHSAIVGADENSSKDIGHALSMCKLATATLGCAVVLIHHSNRAGTGYRGSGSILGSVNSMVNVKPTSGKYSRSCEKLKDGEAWKEQTYDLVSSGDKGSVRVWWDEAVDGSKKVQSDRTDVISFFSQYPGKCFSVQAISEATGVKDSYLRNLLPSLVEEGSIKKRLTDEKKDSSNRNPWLYGI